MSQEKVDKYKKEKYARKHTQKKRSIKKICAYVAATLVALAFVIYIGYSCAVATGLYKPEVVTTQAKLSDDELESLREKLIQEGDTNVNTEAASEAEKATDAQNATVTAESTVTETESAK